MSSAKELLGFYSAREEEYKFPAPQGSSKTGSLDFLLLRDTHILTKLDVKNASRLEKLLNSNKDTLK